MWLRWVKEIGLGFEEARDSCVVWMDVEAALLTGCKGKSYLDSHRKGRLQIALSRSML